MTTRGWARRLDKAAPRPATVRSVVSHPAGWGVRQHCVYAELRQANGDTPLFLSLELTPDEADAFAASLQEQAAAARLKGGV